MNTDDLINGKKKTVCTISNVINDTGLYGRTLQS